MHLKHPALSNTNRILNPRYSKSMRNFCYSLLTHLSPSFEALDAWQHFLECTKSFNQCASKKNNTGNLSSMQKLHAQIIKRCFLQDSNEMDSKKCVEYFESTNDLLLQLNPFLNATVSNLNPLEV